MNFSKFERQLGQVIVIVLLVVVIGLTIGLTIASRQVKNIKLTAQSELSQKAFSAAEAGIEDALRRDLKELLGPNPSANIPSTPFDDSQYQVEIKKTGGAATNQYISQRTIARDDITQVSTTGMGGATLSIYWGPGSDDLPNNPQLKASIEIIELYNNSGWQLKRYAFNPFAKQAVDAATNGFVNQTSACSPALDCSFAGQTFTEKTQITLSTQTEAVRIRPVYYSSYIGVKSSGANFPDQSYTITSTGTISGISRRIEVTRSVNNTPSIFDFVIYTGEGSSLSKD